MLTRFISKQEPFDIEEFELFLALVGGMKSNGSLNMF